MGKVEKVVVLGVIGLVLAILVVSLTADDPLSKETLAAVNPPASGAPPPALAAGPATPPTSPLLSTNVASEPAGATPPPTAAPVLPAGSILRTMDGLEDSYMADMKFYTWQAGDSFPILAQRFYGDLTRLATLRRVNEGRFDVQPGERIFIPVFDLDGPAPGAAPMPFATPAVAAPGEPATAPGLAAAAAPAASSIGGRIHVVKSGESLWRIAAKELGAGTRWKEIYDANRDVLPSPEALHPGLKLRIP